MQYGLMPGRGTVDAVFVLRRLSEKLRAKNKKLFFVFVDLEKAFDQMPREVICFALRPKGVQEYLVNELCLFIKVVTAVSVDGELSSSFSVKLVSISLLVFIIVTHVLTEDGRDVSLMELLYAEDLVLFGESLNEVTNRRSCFLWGIIRCGYQQV